MAEGIVFVLFGLFCFQFSSATWLLAMSDERFLLMFGERNARRFNEALGLVLVVIGFCMTYAKL